MKRLATTLVLALAAAAPSAAGEPALDADRAARAFERFRSLEGAWRTRSTKGWSGRLEMRPVARGTAVLALSEFDDAPRDRAMVVVVHLDGDRLLLTHYCEAGNQVRLVATRVSGDLGEVHFEFLDGTNLASRDEGHMDRVVYRFESADRWGARWTWYQDGEETWLEEIVHVRDEAATAASTEGDTDLAGRAFSIGSARR